MCQMPLQKEMHLNLSILTDSLLFIAFPLSPMILLFDFYEVWNVPIVLQDFVSNVAYRGI